LPEASANGSRLAILALSGTALAAGFLVNALIGFTGG